MNIIICDEKKRELENTKKAIKIMSKKRNVDAKIKTFESGKQLIFEAEDIINKTDIIFMDVYKPYVDGFNVANSCEKWGF
ncbi:MAG: hypothetical protein ACRCU3_09540 [Eubacteriaceae bacterium]